MKYILSGVLALLMITSFVSCKEDVKEDEPVIVEKKELTQEEKDAVNSVAVRMGATPEINYFSRYLLSAGLLDNYTKGKGPFTVFAPTNEAFANMPDDLKKAISNPKNKEILIALLKNHIIEGDYNSVTLTQMIKSDSSTVSNSSGMPLTASFKDTTIVISDGNGNNVNVGKSDIMASNGVVHVIDQVILGSVKVPEQEASTTSQEVVNKAKTNVEVVKKDVNASKISDDQKLQKSSTAKQKASEVTGAKISDMKRLEEKKEKAAKIKNDN